MNKEGLETQKCDTVLLVNSKYGNTPGYGNTSKTPTYDRKTGWYIGWSFAFIITLTAQIIITIYVIFDLIYILQNIKSWPKYSNQHDAKGIIAIGNKAFGIIAIGQEAHGVIAIGQFAFGIISIGQIGLGLLFTLCQCGGGLCWAIGQCTTGAKCILAQVSFSSWKSGPAQLGFNIGSSIIKGTPLIRTCHAKCGYKKYNINSNNNKVKCAVNAIMNAINNPWYWPKEAKQKMAQGLHLYDIETVIKNVVNKSVEGKYHGLNKMNLHEREEVIRCLIELKYEFKSIAFKNFPL